MPTYDYHCPANGRTVEVFHSFSIELKTWGELCTEAEISPGETHPDAPVERLIGGGLILKTKSRGGGNDSCCGVTGCNP